MSGFPGTKQNWKRCMQKEKILQRLATQYVGNWRWNEVSVWKVQLLLAWRLCQIKWFRRWFLCCMCTWISGFWFMSILCPCCQFFSNYEQPWRHRVQSCSPGRVKNFLFSKSSKGVGAVGGPPNLIFNLYWGSFPAGKMAGPWTLPPTIA
jgi:hypothetical protein